MWLFSKLQSYLVYRLFTLNSSSKTSILTITPWEGGIYLFAVSLQIHTMDRVNFLSVHFNFNDLYTYAKDQDKALLFFGPGIIDAVFPG